MKKTILALLSSFIFAFILIQLFSNRINNILYNYVNLEVDRITSNVVDSSVNKILSKKMDDNLFMIEKNAKGEIQTIDYNTRNVNKLLNNISKNIQNRLIDLEDGKLNHFSISDTFSGKKFHYVKNGVICEIPMGSLSNNGFLANIGPVIPIKMSFLGQISCNLESKVKNYGINNLYLEINVEVEVKERITMPKMSKDSIIRIKAPLTVKIIQGIVPNYYGGNLTQDSNIFSLPKRK